MMGNSVISTTTENLASVTTAAAASGPKIQKRCEEKGKVWCNYSTSHKETCWKLHWKPPNLKNNIFHERNGRGMQAVAENQPGYIDP